MVNFSKVRDDLSNDLEDQVACLSKEVAVLRKALGKRGASAYEASRDTAADLYDEVIDRIQDAMPVVRKRAKDVEVLAKENPATAAAVGLIVVGLIASLVLSRR